MQHGFARIAAVAVATGVLIAAATAAAPAGSAATGYSLTPGGRMSVGSSGTLNFVDSTSPDRPRVACSDFSASGTATAGSHRFVPATYPGNTTGLDPAAVLSAQSLARCANPNFENTTFAPSGSWYLGVSSRTSGGANGYLYNVSATVVLGAGSPNRCTFAIAGGAVYGKYTNATGVFSASTAAGLTVTGVTGAVCSLFNIKNHDHAYLSGAFRISPIQTIG